MFTAVIVAYFVNHELLKSVIVTLLEPAGWFLMFYGFDNAFYGEKQKKPELEFYEKMSKADVSFISY